MNTYIVDASVAVKWFIKEENQESAIRLADRCEQNKIKLMVPDFFFVEIANVLWNKTVRNLLKVSEAMEMTDKLMKLALGRYSDYELSAVALENALQYGISVYDALYVSLAEIYMAPLVTADETLLKACKGRFRFIEPLEELKI
ncbi:MAG TPA: type II toxin-antitoxin system VapC family toxin [bacterium]|nr:type II toxin-antitoxin system VapC family toxin [bacterium]